MVEQGDELHLLVFPCAGLRRHTRSSLFAAITVEAIWQNPQANPTLPHSASQIGETWLPIVTYGSVASCVFWVWRMRGFRWFAASLMLLLEVPA
jgi:hypothetical protein